MKRTILAATMLLALSGLAACAHSGHKDADVSVSTSELPPAVRATLEREARGGKVTEIEREVKEGRVIYSADVTMNGRDWDLDIDTDGRVISKELEKAGEKE